VQPEEVEKAINEYARALELDPEVLEKNARAGITAQIGSPEKRAIYYMLAKIHAKRGDSAQGLQGRGVRTRLDRPETAGSGSSAGADDQVSGKLANRNPNGASQEGRADYGHAAAAASLFLAMSFKQLWCAASSRDIPEPPAGR